MARPNLDRQCPPINGGSFMNGENQLAGGAKVSYAWAGPLLFTVVAIGLVALFWWFLF